MPAFEQRKHENGLTDRDADRSLLDPLSDFEKRHHGRKRPSQFDKTGFSEYTTPSSMSNFEVLVPLKLAYYRSSHACPKLNPLVTSTPVSTSMKPTGQCPPFAPWR